MQPPALCSNNRCVYIDQCRNRDLESWDNPTPAPTVEPDLLQERAVLFYFLAKTIDSDDSEDNEVDCVCSNCKNPPKEEGKLKR